MNRRPTRASLATAITLIVAGTAAGQKPVITSQVITDYMPVPDTLAGLVNSADAVVRATVKTVQDVTVTDQPRTSAKTTYTLAVTEVLKGGQTLAPGRSLTVVRSGGDVDLGDRIQRSIDPHFAPFQLGEEYVLLLHWNPYLSQYQIQWGPDGAFHVSAGVVQSMGHGAVAKQVHGHAVDGLLYSIRSLSASGC